MRCWKCDRKGHNSFGYPLREKWRKSRRGDAYDDWMRKHKKLRAHVEYSVGSEYQRLMWYISNWYADYFDNMCTSRCS